MRRVTALLAAVFLTAAATPAARAIDHSKGYPGFCKDDNGVTVVVDFQQLGGTTIVRCNPQTTRGAGAGRVEGRGFPDRGRAPLG